MSKIELAKSLQQDLNDLKGVFNYRSYGLSEEQAKTLARGILANLQDHIEELIRE